MYKIVLIISILTLFFSSCSNQVSQNISTESIINSQEDLFKLLEKAEPSSEESFAVIKHITTFYRNSSMNNELILFLTNHVASNPNDTYNAYWLLLTAYVYLEEKAAPIAEMYFERIIKNYEDLSIQGQSIHVLCLQNLLQISQNPQNRVDYLVQLITHFPDEVNKTELYARLANEYETLAEWELAIKAHSNFLDQDDSPTTQVSGIPDAYSKARKQVDFNNSPKDWTFETLEELESAVKTALYNYQYWRLEQYKSKVNFFAMSWTQTSEGANTVADFLISDYASGKRIRFSQELDQSSTPDEAYLRTWGWRQYVDVWYLYFRKVNFPLDPEIHGRWEWAGIYYGEKL